MTDYIQARADDLETRTVENELVLLDLRTQTYLSLNRTGAELWSLMVEGAHREKLVMTLRDRYRLDATSAERDVDALVAQLRNADLLQPEERRATGNP
jgi:hypothetical protein